jgi:hypothetical protein
VFKGGLASTSIAGLPGGGTVTDGIELGDWNSLWLRAPPPCDSEFVDAVLIGADDGFSAGVVGEKLAGTDEIGCFDGEVDGIELREGFNVGTAEGILVVLGLDVGSVYSKIEKERSILHPSCVSANEDLHCNCEHLPVVLVKPILTTSM